MFDSVLMNSLGFVAGAIAVWWSGTWLTVYADVIAERTGMGRAFAGLLLLGGATSLPEIATTATASAAGAAQLAGSNLLGGVAMQIAVLAVVDAIALRGKALTFVSPRPVLLMQGVLLVLMIALAAMAIAAGEVFSFAGIGLWSLGLLFAYLGALYMIWHFEGDPRWEPTGRLEELPQSAVDLKDEHDARYRSVSTGAIWLRLLGTASVVLVGGYTVSTCAEAIVNQTGISGGIVGATLLALATSLPEVSTTWSAVKIGAYGMAVADILGTNSLEIALLLPADIFYREGPIINQLGADSLFLAALGISMTCVYLWGLLERRDQTVLGMGVDSALVLVLYAAGMAVYFGMT